MAAVLAGGEGAALSHRSAAENRGLLTPVGGAPHVTVPGRSGRRRPRIELHASRDLRAKDVERVDGIPTTSLARTLLDLAAATDRRTLERAIDQAETLRTFDRRPLDDLLLHANGHRGTAALRALLAIHDPARPTATRSELEERFLAIIDASHLPRPLVNVTLRIHDRNLEVDFLWSAARLVVETDGHRYHRTPKALQRDAERRRLLTLAGYTVLVFTWRDLGNPAEVVREIHSLLA